MRAPEPRGIIPRAPVAKGEQHAAVVASEDRKGHGCRTRNPAEHFAVGFRLDDLRAGSEGNDGQARIFAEKSALGFGQGVALLRATLDFSRLRVPGPNDARLAQGHDPATVSADRGLPGGVAELQDRRVGLARAPLPDAGALAGHGEQFLAIRAVADGGDGLAVVERGQREAARGDLPDAGRLIASAGNDEAAIRAEAGVKDGVVVPEHLERPSIPGVPQAHRFVGTRAQDHVVVRTEGDRIDPAIVLLGKKVVGGEVFPAVPPHHGFARENVPNFHRGGSFVRLSRSRDEPEVVGGKSQAIHGLLVAHVAEARDHAGPGAPNFHLPAGAGPSVRLRALDGSAGGDIIAVRAEADLADFARPFDRCGEGKAVRNPAHLDHGAVLRFLAIDEGHAVARGAQRRRDHGAAQFAEVADGPAIAFPDGGLALSVVVASHREDAASGAVSGLDHLPAGERKLGEALAGQRIPQPHHAAPIRPGVGKRQDRAAILRIEARPVAALQLIFFQKRQAQTRQLRQRGPDPDAVDFIGHPGLAILAARAV